MNAFKPIGEQYYMTLDSISLTQERLGADAQHAVMTSNCMFDVNGFTAYDFFNKQFAWDADKGTYHLYEPSWWNLWGPGSRVGDDFINKWF